MNIVWLLVVLGAAILVQVAFFGIAGQKGIGYTRFFSKNRARVGDELEMVEIITSHRAFPTPWIRAESRIPSALRFASQAELSIEGDLYHRSVFTLMPFQRIRRRYSLTCMHRGVYRVDTVTLTTGDLLGLYSNHKTFQLDASILVYPAIGDLDSVRVPSRQWQGDTTVRRWIMPDPFLVNGVREYRMGDNPRDIHPGATARTGQLQVKTHDFTATPKILLVLNVQNRQNQWGPLNEAEKEGFEDTISMLATTAEYCFSRGIACGFACNGRLAEQEEQDIVLMPRNILQQRDALMEMLARLQPDKKSSFHLFLAELALRLPQESQDLVVYTFYWSQELEEIARSIRAKGHTVEYRLIDGPREAQHAG